MSQEIVAMRQEGLLSSPPITSADFERALQNTSPSVGTGDELARYDAWNAEFGAR